MITFKFILLKYILGRLDWAGEDKNVRIDSENDAQLYVYKK